MPIIGPTNGGGASGRRRTAASQRYQRREKRYKRYEKQLPGTRVHSVRSRRRCLAVGRGQPPCGFALLPAYLLLLVLGDEPAAERGPLAPVGRAVAMTGAVSLGLVAVFGAFGLLAAPGGGGGRASPAVGVDPHRARPGGGRWLALFALAAGITLQRRHRPPTQLGRRSPDGCW